MQYYEVLVASQKYHGDKALTYSFDGNLVAGTIVTIPLQRQRVPGVIQKTVSKPRFNTKEIEAVLPLTPLPRKVLDLIMWLKDYYPAPLGQLLTLILPSTLTKKTRDKHAQKATTKPRIKLPELKHEQKDVVQAIQSSDARMHLVHGETGTGKTRVYLELIKSCQERNKSTILLTPEIGLTSQLSKNIEEIFPDKVVILHSNLTPAERRIRWYRILESTDPLVVIGPRSALFAPLDNVGLIILDEAHDTAYKQEQSPYYQATRVAAKLAELHIAKVVLGTATPSIADYYTFLEKKLPIHRMKQLAVANDFKTETSVIDLNELTNFTQSRWVSNQIIESIKENLSDGTQSLLFLNRRGSARIILCQNCGWNAVCPHCDVTLTYHADTHRQQCHTCGFRSSAPNSCPSCKGTDITFKSAGTKTITSELERLFPHAKILRIDGDSTKPERLENTYEDIKNGKYQIIVGTQVVSKGLDLPKLGLVAVIMADTGLNFPDFTAEERTFQLLSQVIGRANRGHRNTKIIVQTFHTDNPTIQLAVKKNYERFYEQQIDERRRYNFPPFKYLLKLEVERSSSKSAEAAAIKLKDMIISNKLGVSLSAPAPAFIEKKQNRYRWHIIASSSQRTSLVKIIQQLPANVRYDIDPTNLL